ncbi:MAG: ABC-2 transporter permease [Lachnospiraceae bacterium]|nr:ABC-2 transporter permease [Lachnospiraceae bacterium]
MKGLLVKDFRQIMKQSKFLLLILILAICLNLNGDGSFVFGYLTFVGGFLVLNTISYDEYDNTLPFLFTLPVERRSYVIEKYVFGILVCVVGWLAGLVVTLVQSLFLPDMPLQEILMSAPVFVPIFMLMLSVMIPFPLIFGREKGTIVMMVVMGAFIALSYWLDRILTERGIYISQFLDSLSGMTLGMVLLIAFAVAFIVLSISCVACLTAMRKKEF